MTTDQNEKAGSLVDQQNFRLSAPRLGLEPSQDVIGQKAILVAGGAESGAVVAFEPDLGRLIDLWPRLTGEGRQALVEHAERLLNVSVVKTVFETRGK